MKSASLQVYAVTTRCYLQGKSLYEAVKEAIAGGATFIQLREKDGPTISKAALLEEIAHIKTLCHKHDVPFVIDDDVALAMETDVDGVHVGQEDMNCQDVRKLIGPHKILGVSAQTVEQAIAAEKQGADYLGVGAVFPTNSKDDAQDVSRQMLIDICEAVSIPVIAIGGITHDNVRALKGTGIVGVAVISEIFKASDITKATQTLSQAVHKMLCDVPTALTIAGSDASGGAGIQADLKTMITNHVYGMSAITALTAQNTLGVKSVMNVTPDFLRDELDAIFTDIYPEAVKIGMVSERALIHVIKECLIHYQAKHIVLDPVMVATSGAKLISDDAMNVLQEELIPLAEVITPNIPEAEILSGMHITNAQEMEAAAQAIYERYHTAVLLKGGHAINDANDLLYDGDIVWFKGQRIDNPNTHGTGCTLSSAIAAHLAKGETLTSAIAKAKQYLSDALAAQLDLGHGSGPLNHDFKEMHYDK